MHGFELICFDRRWVGVISETHQRRVNELHGKRCTTNWRESLGDSVLRWSFTAFAHGTRVFTGKRSRKLKSLDVVFLVKLWRLACKKALIDDPVRKIR
jgi:hypothetical protein